MEWTDSLVIGSGVTGLACAAELARRGREVVILEAAPRWGEGISSRNSEVIHAGLYYPPGSLKARWCLAGNRELKHFADAHGVPWRALGKWLVATDDAQRPALTALRDRAADNGVPLAWVAPARIAREEPALAAVAALESPTSAIIDSHALMQALLAEAEAKGAVLVTGHRVIRCRPCDGGIELEVTAGDSRFTLAARRVVNAAGPWAGPLLQPPQRGTSLYFAKGSYFAYHGRVPFRRLIYPLPMAGGLGIHLTLDMAGRGRFGPDVQWVASPDDVAVDPARREAFAAAIRPWWPGVDARRLAPDYAGVRPKLGGPDEPAADFRIEGPAEHGVPGLVQLLGIESPGLTACLPLARHVADRLAGPA